MYLLLVPDSCTYDYYLLHMLPSISTFFVYLPFVPNKCTYHQYLLHVPMITIYVMYLPIIIICTYRTASSASPAASNDVPSSTSTPAASPWSSAQGIPPAATQCLKATKPSCQCQAFSARYLVYLLMILFISSVWNISNQTTKIGFSVRIDLLIRSTFSVLLTYFIG